MNEKEELLKVGKYNSKFNDILGLDIENMDIYRSKGLPSHMVKRKHYKCLKYIDYIPDIISEPDSGRFSGRIKEIFVDNGEK